MPRPSADGLEQVETELVDELARVINDPEIARMVATRGGLPRARLPPFNDPLVFWTKVVQAAADGQVPGEVQAIADEAAKQFPANEVFARYQGRSEGVADDGFVQDPFVGLRAIDEEHRDLFFGRKEETEELVEKLRRAPLVMVVGDSGSGKSSLVLAGLVPRFREGALVEDGERSEIEFRHVIKMSPRGTPRRQLGEGVYEAGKVLGLPDERRRTFAKWASSGDADDVRLALRCDLDRERAQVLLVVDQLEELWTSSPREERSAFVDLLLDLVTSADGWLFVVLTMRRDYANLCNELEPLKAWLEREDRRARYDLRRISETGLRRVVTEPLRLAGVGPQQREALAEVVLGDVGERPGDLALVQMALSETWNARKEHGSDLVVVYHHVGRVEGALAKAADAVRDKMNDDERAHLDAILVRLVQLGDTGGATRRLATRDEFADERWTVVQHLASKDGKRLMVLGGKEDSPTAEIAHEALVTAWPYFQELLFGHSKDKRVLDALVPKTKAWAAEDNAKDNLLAVGADLDAFEQLLVTQPSWFSAAELGFVEASTKARQYVLRVERRRQRRLLGTAMTASAVLLGLLILAGWQYLTAAEARDDAQQLALEKDEEAKKARAMTRAEQGARASLLARVPGRELDALELGVRAIGGVKSWNDSPSAQVARGLFEALAHARRLVVLQGHTKAVVKLAWTADGTRLGTASEDGTARLWDGKTSESLAILEGHTKAVVELAWAADGTRLGTASEDGTARLWDGKTGESLAILEGHTKAVVKLAWTADGTRLGTASEDGTARLWDGKTGEPLVILRGHTEPVLELAWAADGTRLGTASEDGTARLWDGKTGESLAVLEGHTEEVLKLAWTTDGTRLGTASRDGTARLWNGKTGELLAILEGHEGWSPVSELAWTADGTRLATANDDGTAMLWDGKTGEALAILEGHEWGAPVLELAWTADGTRLATASEDRTARLWDGKTGAPLATLDGHKAPVLGLAWTADGTRLGTASEDGSAKLWDGKKGEPLTSLQGHTNVVRALAWTIDGTCLATGDGDGTVRLWYGKSSESLAILQGHTEQVLHLAWTADGTRLATAGGDETRLWDGKTGESLAILQGHTDWVRALAWMADGTRLATAGGDGTARLWDGKTGEPLAILEGHAEPVLELAWTTDGTRLATAGGDGTARLWDGKTGDPLAILQGHAEPVLELAWTADGTRLATAGVDSGTARLWDGKSGESLAILQGHTEQVRQLAWAADGTRLATASEDWTARLWDGKTGEPLAVLQGHTGEVLKLAWTADGTRLATASVDGTTRLWDGKTGEPLATLQGHTMTVRALAWTADGTRLATASEDWTARLWEGRTGESLATLQGHTDVVRELAWTADGTRLATASEDWTARLWDGKTGESLATLQGHTGEVLSLAWTADGTRLATASYDGTARVWLGSTQEWLKRACEILDGS